MTPPPKAPPKPPPKLPPKPGAVARTSARETRQAKSFSVAPWTGAGEGEKIVLYGKSGIGKTTLAAMAPNPVFIGIDDGGRKITNPLTGQPVLAVHGIETFHDVRDALGQTDLWPEGCTVVIDTLTKMEELIQAYIMETVTQNGQRVTSFRKYGWDGDRHILDAYRLLLNDLDVLSRKGRNVLLLCQQGQIRVANAEGADYLEDGPFLQHRNDCSTREEVKQWADHVLRIGYLDLSVVKDDHKAKAGKVVSEDATRAVFSGGAQHFTAKSRPVNGERIPTVISFESESDNALWQFLFPERSE